MANAEVEAILQSKWVNDKKRYLVKFKGCPDSQAEWKTEKDLKNCRELIKQFELNRVQVLKLIGITDDHKYVFTVKVNNKLKVLTNEDLEKYHPLSFIRFLLDHIKIKEQIQK